MTTTTRWILAVIGTGVVGAGLYLVIANPGQDAPTSSTTAGTPTEASPAMPTAADAASPLGPTLSAAPLDDMDLPAASLAPATTSATSSADAQAVATAYYDILVDATMDPTQWAAALKPLTTTEQYAFAVDGLDGTWYDGLGTRTGAVTVEYADNAGTVYAHISSTNNDDIVLVLIRPTEGDVWRVDGYKK